MNQDRRKRCWRRDQPLPIGVCRLLLWCLCLRHQGPHFDEILCRNKTSWVSDQWKKWDTRDGLVELRNSHIVGECVGIVQRMRHTVCRGPDNDCIVFRSLNERLDGDRVAGDGCVGSFVTRSRADADLHVKECYAASLSIDEAVWNSRGVAFTTWTIREPDGVGWAKSGVVWADRSYCGACRETRRQHPCWYCRFQCRRGSGGSGCWLPPWRKMKKKTIP